MKVKLFKINNFSEAYNQDDYYNVRPHIVTNYSNWEELDEKELSRVERWIEETNRSGASKYMLISESEKTINETIKEQIKREEKMKEERKRQEEEEKKKKEREGELRAAKKTERLKKQLIRIQKELGEKNES